MIDNLTPVIGYQEPAWLTIAFFLGFAAKQIGLPPMVGFLGAGFALSGLGGSSGPFLQAIADLGVTLLLFSIGLKLDIRSLLRAEIWATTLTHMAVTVVLLSGLGMMLMVVGVTLFSDLTLQTALIAAFALSFSSTVFAVKVLEAKGEMASRHGRIAIGILIMQDIVAVIFLAASTGKIPSPWAIALLGLIPARPLFRYFLDRVGHGELLILMSFAMAMTGAALFESVGLKGDLGALMMGVLLSGHPRATEMSRSILNFKELLLIGFFLNIGLAGLPSTDGLILAVLLLAYLPIKTILFFGLLVGFRRRARTASLGAMVLSNYSEFGLIVASIAAGAGWMPMEWVTNIAITLALSFVLAAPINNQSNLIYRRFRTFLDRFHSKHPLPEDGPVDTGDAWIAIFGMGRIGSSTYDAIEANTGHCSVIGIDFNDKTVASHLDAGRNVIVGDAANPGFWERLRSHQKIRHILLTMPNHREQMIAIQTLQERGFQGVISATARFPDEIEDLKAMGVANAFSIYTEAGIGFASEVCSGGQCALPVKENDQPNQSGS